MKHRYFNRTGYCKPDIHYIVDSSRGLKDLIFKHIENQEYFVIHAPRQTGKTTLLHGIVSDLNKTGKYLALAFSLETAGYLSIPVAKANYEMICSLYSMALNLGLENEMPELPNIASEMSLKTYLQLLSVKSAKPVVLFIDEIDSLYDDVLVSILRQLRDGFQLRPTGFPVSLALVGLRDIRDYKMKVRPEHASLGSGSPFNIKAESYRLENFTLDQVSRLLRQHTEETGQEFTDEVCAAIYECTGGQPWLTNALAYEIVDRILKEDYNQKITLDLVDKAKEQLIKRRDTHLDSLADKLNDPRIKPIILAILNGDTVIFDDYNDSLQYALDLGIVARVNGNIQFSNKIYKEVIPRVLNQSFQDSIGNQELAWYLYPDGRLNMDALLKEFQEFYRENAESWIDRFSYKEAGQQLLLMAFLQRVMNGGARLTREMAVGLGRVDMLVEFKDQRFVMELKIKHNANVLQKGLQQTSRYLDTVGMDRGYLVLFEKQPSSVVSWDERIKWEMISYEFMGKQKEIVLVEM